MGMIKIMKYTVNINNVIMDYCCFGNGKTAFVIIPGLSIKPVLNYITAIESAYSTLCDDFTIYLLEYRNNLPDNYTIEEMEADFFSVIKSLGLNNIILYGVSLGGMVSQILAANHPNLVNKLILCSTCIRVNDYFSNIIKKWIELADNLKSDELSVNMTDMIYSEKTLAEFRNAILLANSGILETELYRFVKLASSVFGFDMTENARKIKCETFVIGSYGDKIMIPEASFELARALSCKLFMYDKSFGHAVYDEARDFLERVKNFIFNANK